MKQFLYLDTDIVNSIIAQEEKGLIQGLSQDNEENKSNNTHINVTGETAGKTEGAFLKLARAEASLTMSGGMEKEYTSGATSHEIISKVLHDSAFDIAYNYIQPQIVEEGQKDSDGYGEYIELTRAFDFVDLEYLENLFSANGLIDFIKKNDREKIEKEAEVVKEGMSHEQLRVAGKQIKEAVKKQITDNEKQYDNVRTMITAFRQLVPYTRMLISHDGYLVPLDDKYFRVGPENLGFKYGGEIICVGMITNIIGADTDPDDPKNIFATLQFAANEVLRKILPTSEENLCVIHPIAVFYRN